MKVTFDSSCNMAYIYLKAEGIKPGEAVKTVHFDKAGVQLCIDLDKDGKMIGIEVFDAANLLPKEVLDSAEQ